MASVFTQIISGQLPGHFLWKDDVCVAILTIAPVVEGHVLVIPRLEVDHWDDLPGETAAHLIKVAQSIAKAQKLTYQPLRVGLIIAGLEVPHTHIHVMPVNSMGDYDFSKASMQQGERLAPVAQKLRQALVQLGYKNVAE